MFLTGLFCNPSSKTSPHGGYGSRPPDLCQTLDHNALPTSTARLCRCTAVAQHYLPPGGRMRVAPCVTYIMSTSYPNAARPSGPGVAEPRTGASKQRRFVKLRRRLETKPSKAVGDVPDLLPKPLKAERLTRLPGRAGAINTGNMSSVKIPH
jgi:hypothetical protein